MGVENVVENNIFALVNTAMRERDGAICGTLPPPGCGSPPDTWSFNFTRNIVMVEQGPLFFATTNDTYA